MSPTWPVAKLDLAVIGAGIYGIQAARTYLSVHPDHNVLVFEATSSIGGVWSSGRIYDDFWTQTPLGIAEFSDMPLEDVPTSDQYYGFFPAKYISGYLQKYVDFQKFAGRSLQSLIRLRSRVLKITKETDGWTLNVGSEQEGNFYETEYHALKIIDATGLTSNLNMPLLPNKELFHGDIVHHLDFGRIHGQLAIDTKLERVIIVGGAKSAADLAYSCAKMEKNVDWVIRKTGAGPAAFVSAKGNAIYKNSNESFYTRITSHFLASIYMDESKTLLGRFLYYTKIGRQMMRFIWNKIDAKAHRLANYEREDGTKNQFSSLKPDTSLFWQNDSTGICQRDDFFDVIAHRVTVHREDTAHMTETGIVLANEVELEADIVICGTGWKTSHPEIVDSEGHRIETSLGLASTVHSWSEKPDREWQELESVAEAQVLHRFPMLEEPPFRADESQETSPLRLYKGILPVHDQSIVFLGQLLLGNNFRVAEVQALFAVAALDKVLTLPSVEDMRKDIALHTAWSKRRYLKKGQHGTWLYWDMVPYTDHLLDHLGLSSHRRRGWLADLFSTCFAKDLTGLIDEYKQKHGEGDEHRSP